MTLTVDDLIAREEIGDIVLRLARGTDRLDEELIASCYHPDGTDDHNVFRGTGAEFARWVVATLPHFEATMHFTGPPHVRVAGDLARVDTSCIAHHISRPDDEGRQTDLVLALRYVDRFERREGSWRVAERVCVFDWTATLPFDPAAGYRFEPEWKLGIRDRTDPSYTDF